jgi:transcriptional regulator with XRE-family HTH domain
MKRKSPGSPELLVPERIRNRREAQGLAAYELAKRVQISASYLSLIEKGAKVPSEEIAVSIARALDDDPEIYRAWVYASRYPDLTRHVERLARLERYGSDPRLRGRLRRGERVERIEERDAVEEADFSLIDDPAVRRLRPASQRMQRLVSRLGLKKSGDAAARRASFAEATLGDEAVPYAGPTVAVPLLADGADPGDDPEQADGLLGILQLDRRVLPRVETGLFAYRPGEAALTRVAGQIEPYDIVVLATSPKTVESSGIYAVRDKGRIVLTRALLHGDHLLLISESGSAGKPVSLRVRSEDALRAALAGVVVTTIRTWPSASVAGVAPIQRVAPAEPRGRSVRLEGDFLVRDCEWRENYGWRPIQRAEDLDYLEAHPGTKIRFRLIRDGKVEYLLEMGPEEWRGALGDHVVHGSSWRRNGYIVAITKRKEGEYGTEFQDRWAPFVKGAEE